MNDAKALGALLCQVAHYVWNYVHDYIIPYIMRGLIIQAVSFCCFSFHLAMGDRLDCMRNLPVWVHKKTLPIIDRKGELALYHLRLHRSIYMHIKLECLLSCNVDESEELMSNLVIYRFNFLGSSAQKLPSMISVLSIFQPAQNVSPSYGPDALSESFRHVLLFLMPLNICLFLSTILKCIG